MVDLTYLVSRQNRHHVLLSKYVNGGVLFGGRMIRSIRRPTELIRNQAGWLTTEYADLSATGGRNLSGDEIIQIDPYVGDNEHVGRLKTLLSKLDADDLAGAYVHGSVGSHEETDYSDLDMLVILGDRAMTDERRLTSVATRLRRSKMHLYAHDPLQHHGWFVLTPFDLANYCEAYFPLPVLEHARSVFSDRGRSLSIRVRDSQSELEDAFGRMAQSIELQLTRERYPRDMYALKSFLSRLLLMPALYVQARDGKGVWKADSFGLAKDDFDERIWHCIEMATEIRAEWRYDAPTAKRWLMSRPDRLGSFVRKRLSGPIPAHVGKLLDPAFTSPSRI